jgi:glycosyltransferase involved in cell wall biosynthesis
MEILHLTQRYWPATGGSENYIGELSTRLAAEGHGVTVVTTDAQDFELFWDPGRQRIAEQESSLQGVRVLRFPVRHMPVAPLSYPAWRRLLWVLSRYSGVSPQTLARLARFTPWTPELWRWLEQTPDHFDIVAGTTICFEPLLEAGLLFATRRGIPFVIHPLTHLGSGPIPGNDAVSSFYTMRHQVELVRRSQAVLAMTAAERDFYVQRGVNTDRITVAGPGVEPERLCGGHGERLRDRHQVRGPLVAFLSSMSFDKGATHTVEAVRLLRAQGHDVHLVLAGALLSPFRRFLERLPAEDRRHMTVLGPIDEQTKLDLLDAMDVLVLPSRTDSFGIVYLEAWSYAKPVIGADVWGINNVIGQRDDGLLVPFGNPPALAEAILTLVQDPALRLQMGRRGQQKMLEQHTWARKYALVRDVYVRLTNQPIARPCAS